MIHGFTFQLDDEFRNRNRKMTALERKNLGDILQKEGCLKDALTVGQIGHDKFLIDGYNTLELCQERGVQPTEPRKVYFKDRQGVLDWIDRRQRSRRNLTTKQMAQRKAERVDRVVEGRQEGKSIRTLAEEEGVSKSTIEDDLKTASVQGRTVEPTSGKITGKSGKKHKPKQAKSGRVQFNFREYDEHLDHVIRGIDELVRAYPEQAGSDDESKCRQLMTEYVNAWKQWKQRIPKESANGDNDPAQPG
jgi:hypothetical protein